MSLVKFAMAGGERLQRQAVVVNSIDLSGTSGKISAVPACLCCCLKAYVEMFFLCDLSRTINIFSQFQNGDFFFSQAQTSLVWKYSFSMMCLVFQVKCDSWIKSCLQIVQQRSQGSALFFFFFWQAGQEVVHQLVMNESLLKNASKNVQGIQRTCTFPVALVV